MENLDSLQFDKNVYDFEEANIYGIYESDGYMTWHIEMFPPGEDNYEMEPQIDIYQPGCNYCETMADQIVLFQPGVWNVSEIVRMNS
jgi:hypothetical protein